MREEISNEKDGGGSGEWTRKAVKLAAAVQTDGKQDWRVSIDCQAEGMDVREVLVNLSS